MNTLLILHQWEATFENPVALLDVYDLVSAGGQEQVPAGVPSLGSSLKCSPEPLTADPHVAAVHGASEWWRFFLSTYLALCRLLLCPLPWGGGVLRNELGFWGQRLFPESFWSSLPEGSALRCKE